MTIWNRTKFIKRANKIIIRKKRKLKMLNVKNIVKLIIIPAKTLANNPANVIPPESPLETYLLRFVINLGLDLLINPISVENVSAVVTTILPIKHKPIIFISPFKRILLFQLELS